MNYSIILLFGLRDMISGVLGKFMADTNHEKVIKYANRISRW